MMCKVHKNRKCYLHLVIYTFTCSSSQLLLILVSCYLIQQMVDLMEGSGVYWYPHQRAYCSAFKNWAGYINAAIDIFFTKETLAVSCTKGNAKKGKNGHHPLDLLVIEALIGRLCHFILVLTGLSLRKLMVDHHVKVSLCWKPRCSKC